LRLHQNKILEEGEHGDIPSSVQALIGSSLLNRRAGQVEKALLQRRWLLPIVREAVERYQYDYRPPTIADMVSLAASELEATRPEHMSRILDSLADAHRYVKQLTADSTSPFVVVPLDRLENADGQGKTGSLLRWLGDTPLYLISEETRAAVEAWLATDPDLLASPDEALWELNTSPDMVLLELNTTSPISRADGDFRGIYVSFAPYPLLRGVVQRFAAHARNKHWKLEHLTEFYKKRLRPAWKSKLDGFRILAWLEPTFDQAIRAEATDFFLTLKDWGADEAIARSRRYGFDAVDLVTLAEIRDAADILAAHREQGAFLAANGLYVPTSFSTRALLWEAVKRSGGQFSNMTADVEADALFGIIDRLNDDLPDPPAALDVGHLYEHVKQVAAEVMAE
jgi:hypothetical protein